MLAANRGDSRVAAVSGSQQYFVHPSAARNVMLRGLPGRQPKVGRTIHRGPANHRGRFRAVKDFKFSASMIKCWNSSPRRRSETPKTCSSGGNTDWIARAVEGSEYAYEKINGFGLVRHNFNEQQRTRRLYHAPFYQVAEKAERWPLQRLVCFGNGEICSFSFFGDRVGRPV